MADKTIIESRSNQLCNLWSIGRTFWCPEQKWNMIRLDNMADVYFWILEFCGYEDLERFFGDTLVPLEDLIGQCCVLYGTSRVNVEMKTEKEILADGGHSVPEGEVY